MKDNGKIIKEMGEENNFGKMEVCIKGIGKITLLMVMEDLYTLMVMYTLVNGLVIRPMEKELIFPNVGLNILVIGLKINKMEMVNKLGLMKLST